jgi:hypothetical protein
MPKTLLLAALLAGLAGPALADTDPDQIDYTPNCTAPAPPGSFTGARASDLAAAHGAVKAYLAASDSYQNCLMLDLGERKDTALFAKSQVPRWIVKQIDDKLAANQAEKERVGADYNAAVIASHAKSP